MFLGEEISSGSHLGGSIILAGGRAAIASFPLGSEANLRDMSLVVVWW